MGYRELLNAIVVRLGFLFSSKKTWVFATAAVFCWAGKITPAVFEKVLWGYFICNVVLHGIDSFRARKENKKLREKVKEA